MTLGANHVSRATDGGAQGSGCRPTRSPGHGFWRFGAAFWSLPGSRTACRVLLSPVGYFWLSRNPIRSVNSSGVKELARLLTGL